MKFKVTIKPDSIGAWEEKTNWFIGERDGFMVGYEGDQLYGYKIGDGRSTWDELNYTNLADLGEFRIYIDKDDTIVRVNLDPDLFALNVESEICQYADRSLRDSRSSAAAEEESIPVKIKVASYDEVNKNGTSLKCKL